MWEGFPDVLVLLLQSFLALSPIMVMVNEEVRGEVLALPIFVFIRHEIRGEVLALLYYIWWQVTLIDFSMAM